MDTEKKRTLYITHRVGKRFRWLEAGIAVERTDGTLDVFLDRMPVGGWNGHILVPRTTARPTARDIPTTTPFDEEAMLAEEAVAVVSH
jgi:hypothetical protein